MNGYLIKQNLSGKDDTIKDILESVGCHSFSNNVKNQIRFALPGHTNPTSGVVDTENLRLTVFNDLNFKGDIVGFICKMTDIPFGEVLIYLCDKLGLQYQDENFQFIKPENFFDKYKKIILPHEDYAQELTPFSQKSTDYVFQPQFLLCQEGISLDAQKKFSIGYDKWSKRILFPHRLYNGEKDEFVGIIGRTTIPQWELLGLPKYFPLKRYPKSQNLYGFWENSHVVIPKNLSEREKLAYRTFDSTHRVVVYEAEKSVLKRATIHDYTAVAICGHSLSATQARILRGMTNIREVIFAMDNDVSEDIMIDMCKKIWNKKTSYIVDKNKDNPEKRILGEKDSPADVGEKDYLTLFKSRIRVS